MSNESERTTALSTITRMAATACQNTFDTTALALTDMEQANIAYGRNYVRLELAASDFLPRTVAGRATPTRGSTAAVDPPPARIGIDTAARRVERARSAGLGRLLATDGFVARDPAERPRPIERRPIDDDPETRDPGDEPERPRLPVLKATSLGMRVLVGWVPVPPDGVEVEPPPAVPSALYVVQRFRLASYARGFGLGDHLYSFTLFPEEEVEIEIKTWKSREQVDKTGSSIFDGQSDTAESSFEEAMQQENATTSKRDKSFEAHVEASGEAGWGWGSASVQAGAKTASAESTEQFAKNVGSATQKVANKANRERKVEVTQSSEVKTTEGEETRTKRKVRNINKCNTLNFNYFQLVRKYETRLELYDIKLRYSSGVPFFDEDEGAWHYEAEEASLREIDSLFTRVLAPGAIPLVKQAVFRILGPGGADDEGLDILTAASTADRMRLDVVPLAEQIAWEEAPPITTCRRHPDREPRFLA